MGIIKSSGLKVALGLMAVTSFAHADINVKKVSGDLAKDFMNEKIWSSSEPDQEISLMAQPMVVPRPKNTETSLIKVTAIHDGKWIAFRLKWADSEISEGGKLGTFSDAVAMQFPVKDNENPPPVMMGVKDDPVHIFHWRFMYQIDSEKGKKTIDKIYPNMTTDMYPGDYKAKGNFQEASQEQKEAFVGGTAAGNPQSFAKSGVDEIFAEGFGSSAVIEKPESSAKGIWKNNEWTVIIARPLAHEGASVLVPGKKSNIAFAVWQGGKNEVGSRKSVEMMWTPLIIQEK